MGDFVVVTLEGDNAAEAMGSFAQGKDEFTEWFVQQVQELHGFDLRQPPEKPPRQVLDSEASA